MHTGNTKIRFNDGALKLMQLNPAESQGRLVVPGTTVWDLPQDALVYSFNATSLEHKWCRATALVRRENVQLLQVKMASGSTFQVEFDRPILAYSAGKVRLVNPMEAKRLCLPSIRKFARCFPEQDKVFAHGKSGRGGGAVSHGIPLNPRTGLFLGLLIGDGCVTQAGQVFLYGGGWKTRNRKIFANISGCGDLPYSGVTCTTRFESEGLAGTTKMSTRTVIANHVWFSRWLRNQIGDDALSKRIPDFCFNAPDDHLWGLFDGLISSDGSVSVNGSKRQKPQLLVSFSTSSPQLVEGFKKLCERLTLRCSVSPYRSEQSGLPAYIINVSTRDLAKAHDHYPVSFVHPTKNAIFRRWIGRVTLEGPGVTGDQVPFPAELEKAFKQAYAWQHERRRLPNGKTDFGPFPTFKYNGHWGRGTARRYVDVHGRFTTWPQPSATYLAILADESIGWDKVVEITAVREASTSWNVVVPGADAIALESGLLVPTHPQSFSATHPPHYTYASLAAFHTPPA